MTNTVKSGAMNKTLSIKHIDTTLIRGLCADAAESHRQRVTFLLHDGLADPVQRFLNVMQPGTYVRPHRHDDPAKWELTVLLSGRMVMLILEADGIVRERIELDAAGPERGLELPPRAWHTSAVLAPNTVLLEIKPGPYDPLTDKDFATWAPAEGQTECTAFERKFRTAQPGDKLAG